MDKLIDSIAIWGACATLVVVQGTSEFSIVGMLAALLALCASRAARWSALRIAIAFALALACALFAPLMPFLPVATCLGMFERPWSVRFAWVAALAIIAWRCGVAYALPVLALSCVAVLLSIRTVRSVADRSGMRISRDALREDMIELADRARASELDPSHEAPIVADAPAFDPLEGLTDRERSVAHLVSEGLDNREIAARLFLSEGTVRNNISAILQKKQLKNRTQLAVLCLSH
ncbi:helix-turn-helix transcriptional regulator [Adlercreutzia murintestinalis]|uniref:helix-turn-helix transcriptional regulator n=1 Tax=Adlercreutzia murintestinalis TaxID=2941325 RepID=UPI00203C014C|nr:helix-turn-helix transcriptional regulator [Adlercreutzia murintestinalis]